MKSAQHSVHPTGGSLRAFRQFVWLEVDDGKVASPRPAWLSTGEAVSRHTSGYPQGATQTHTVGQRYAQRHVGPLAHADYI
jgi:hypothetical protein